VWLKYLDKFKPKMTEGEVKAILPTLDIKDIVETSVPGLDIDKLSVQQLIKVFIFIMNETTEEFKSGLPQDLIEQQDIKKNMTEQQL